MSAGRGFRHPMIDTHQRERYRFGNSDASVGFVRGWMVALGMVAFVLAVSWGMWTDAYRLEHDGVRTRGVVMRKEPRNHQTVRYAFQAGGRTYTASGPVSNRGVPPLASLSPGDSVLVTYVRGDPAISTTGEPESVARQFGGFVAMLGGMAVFAGVVTEARRTRILRERKHEDAAG